MRKATVGLAALSLLACRTASSDRTATPSNSLVGTWKLVSFTRTDLSTGETTDVFGKAPIGYITYTPEGRMTAILVKEGRPRPEVASMTDTERAHLFQNMFAYAGTYSFDGKTVTHHVDISWNEAWTGTAQERDVEFEGNRIVLSVRPAVSAIDGKRATARLVWERVSATPQ